jgi:hypothetical protein
VGSRLPAAAQRRYERETRGRADRWGFVLVAAAVLFVIGFIGDQAVLSLQWLITLPASAGFTMFSGPPVRHYQGYAAPPVAHESPENK